MDELEDWDERIILKRLPGLSRQVYLSGLASSYVDHADLLREKQAAEDIRSV
jgi:hypothetical protein